jgi:hypothetical protein
MKIERTHLQAAVERGILSEAQVAQLWALLEEQAEGAPQDRPSFTITHVLYYLGGLIALGGMSIYVTLGWQRLQGTEIFLIAAAYAAVGLLLTHYLLEVKRLPIPAGLTAAFVVAMAPLAVYGLQRGFGLWPITAPYRDYHAIIDGRWIVMELATLAAGAAMLWRYRLPFLLMPVAVTLWYMSMDLAPILYTLVYGPPPTGPAFGYPLWSQELWRLKQWVSVGFGLIVIAGALAVDLRSHDGRDFAFWLYLAGVAAFWGGLSSMSSGSALGKAIYLLINVVMVLIAAVLGRRVFAVFGALGVAAYLGDLAMRTFADSILFPMVLTAIGFGVVMLGVWWQRYEQRIAQSLRPYLPESLRKLIESRSA